MQHIYSKRYVMDAPVVEEEPVATIDWNEVFEYDTESPTFLTNVITRSPKAQEGYPAGCRGAKEIKVKFQGRFYRHARIIWEMFNGPIPLGYTVGFKDDNEFNLLKENLLLRSHRQRGLHTTQRMGASGLRGVRIGKNGKWTAYAKVYGKTVYLGTYDNSDDAVKARKFALKFNQE